MIQYNKELILLCRALYSIKNELNFYQKYNYQNNFIVNIKYAFQDTNSFYLIEEFLEGGDLRYHLNRHIFTEQRAKFLIACLILGVEFLHKQGYVHRNLKPENLLLESNGYLKINDMKLLRETKKINSFDSSGTPGYMAPEVLFRQSHGCCSDVFSIGIICYEMMFDKLPFKASSRKEYAESLLSDKEYLIKEYDLPEGWSRECANFINKCIQKRVVVRIGYNGIEELKEHKWFRDINWNELSQMKVKAPFVPGVGNYKTRSDKERVFNNSNIKEYLEYYEVCRKFEGYYYNYKNDIEKMKSMKHNNSYRSKNSNGDSSSSNSNSESNNEEEEQVNEHINVNKIMDDDDEEDNDDNNNNNNNDDDYDE